MARLVSDMQVLKIKCYVFVMSIPVFLKWVLLSIVNLGRAHCLKKGRTKNENEISVLIKDKKNLSLD